MNSQETVILEAIQCLNQQEGTNDILLNTANKLQLLGNLYMDQSMPEKAGHAYLECIINYHQLASRDNNYSQLLEDIFAEIAIHYTTLGQSQHFPTAILQVVQSEPCISAPVLYGTLTHLGKAGNIQYLNQALQGYRILAAADPDTYNPLLAYTITAIADITSTTANTAITEKLYQEAVALYEDSLSPDTFLYFDDMANLLQKLAEMKLRKDQPHVAIDYMIRSSTLFTTLAGTDPNKYMMAVARSYYKCAILMHQEFRNQHQAIQYLEKSLLAWEETDKIHPNQYTEEYQQSRQALANMTSQAILHSSFILNH